MKIHTGVPLLYAPLYANEGTYSPNFTLRWLPQQATHHKDRNSNQSIYSHVETYYYFYCNRFEVKAYIKPNTANASLYNSLVMNGGGVA